MASNDRVEAMDTTEDGDGRKMDISSDSVKDNEDEDDTKSNGMNGDGETNGRQQCKQNGVQREETDDHQEEPNIRKKRHRNSSESSDCSSVAVNTPPPSRLPLSPSVSTSADFQKKFKELFAKYYKTITNGCFRPLCQNMYCAKNPVTKQRDANEAFAFALSLTKEHLSSPSPSSSSSATAAPASTTSTASVPSDSELHPLTSFCIDDEIVPFISYDTLKALFNDAKQGNAEGNAQKEQEANRALMKTLNGVFSSIEALNLSFLKTGIEGVSSPDDSGVDAIQVEKSWELIVSSESSGIVNSVRYALETLVRDLRFGAKNLRQPWELRLFFTLLLLPVQDDDDWSEVLGNAFASVSFLSEKSVSTLMKWTSRFGTENLGRRIRSLHTQITLLCYTLEGNHSLAASLSLQGYTQIMRIYHGANDLLSASQRPLEFDLFYNDVLCESIDARNEFLQWKIEKEFSFCNYPFILNPRIKSRILRCDSILKMHQTQQRDLPRLFRGQSAPYLRLCITREHLRLEALHTLLQIKEHDPNVLRKPLKVKFLGEEGIDEGGVRKEFFQLIVRELFNEGFGMFSSNSLSRKCYFNANSGDLADFELIGMILGLAVYNDVILDIHFPFVVYKKLMGGNSSLEDLHDTHPQVYSSLSQLQSETVEDLDITFQVASNYYGATVTHDLIPNGGEIPVTATNFEDFKKRYSRWLLDESIEEQFKHFEKGFWSVCDDTLKELFRPEELELLICGEPELDFDSLEKHTRYENYDASDEVVRNFWEIIHSLSLEQKKRFLFFATGSDRAPIGGLGHLGFVVVKHGEDGDRLPQAHTCFNVLLLPPYKETAHMRNCLITAINNAEGFGML